MDPQIVAMFTALMHQQVAIMEAMKTENQQRLSEGRSVAYGEDEFYAVADELGRIAESLRG